MGGGPVLDQIWNDLQLTDEPFLKLSPTELEELRNVGEKKRGFKNDRLNLDGAIRQIEHLDSIPRQTNGAFLPVATRSFRARSSAQSPSAEGLGGCEAELIEGRIWVVARRDIQAGEEITFNYRYDLESFREYPCHCGSPDCVGFILAEEFHANLRPLPGSGAREG